MFNEKKGQVTVFIILGVILVIIIGLVLYVYGEKLKIRQPDKIDTGSMDSLKNYITNCIKKEGNTAIDSLGEHGGRINPKSGYWYLGKKLTYLCYTEELKPCENKVPFIRKEMEMEINSYLSTRVKSCINLDNLRKQGYVVEEGKMNLSTEINDQNVMVIMNYPLTVSKGGSRVSQNFFSVDFKSSLGRFADIAAAIVDSEVQYGRFFNELYEISHSDVTVNRWKVGKSSVYTIKIMNEPREFKFATKGWVY
jgi:hypothetical protein